MSEEREAALRIISFNEMNGNGENDAIDEVCVARAYLALSAPNPAVERPADPRGWHEAIEAAAEIAEDYDTTEWSADQVRRGIAFCIRALSPAPKDREGG